jgi:hypothetical protein
MLTLDPFRSSQTSNNTDCRGILPRQQSFHNGPHLAACQDGVGTEKTGLVWLHFGS